MAKDEENGWLIVAWGCAITLVVLAVGWALKWFLPVLFASIAATVTIIMTGAATGLFAPVVIQIGVTVAIATGSTISITLLAKGLAKAKDKPFDWMAAVIAILQPLSLDFVKEWSPDQNPIGKLTEKAVALILFLMGVLLWKQTSKLVKAIGFVMILLPPILVITRLVALNWHQGFRAAVLATPAPTWFALGIMTFGSISVIVLKYKLDD